MFLLNKTEINALINKQPLIEKLINKEPFVWINPNRKTMNLLKDLPISIENMHEAEALWERFKPFLKKAFPELKNTDGVIESPLVKIEKFKQTQFNHPKIAGSFYLKCDHSLPIAGSIKARGGFYEVLKYAENLALEHALLKEGDNYEVFASEKFKSFFNNYTIGVGSTGNLGLSIGIMSAKLGFQVNVYMSSDAKAWKKNLLKEHGAIVHEFSGDFSEAIYEGRKKTIEDSFGYFVDDEDSRDLFLGYSTAAFRLKQQLAEQAITIDEEHPLFVYLPCGVGGSPGGVAFGLKQLFGDAVHCFFVEPTESPAVLLGLMSGKMANICVQDIGIGNKTEADGLAVGRPSKFATSISNELISGMYTLEDDTLFKLLATLKDTEHIDVEPSATAGLIGPLQILQSDYMSKIQAETKNITHIAWSTGGLLVPSKEKEQFYQKGVQLKKNDKTN